MAEIDEPTTEVLVPGKAGRAAGRALRAAVPRSSQSMHPAAVDPKRDVVAMLEASCAGRIEQLLPLRWSRMSTSVFAFFRGTADIQAYDLATTPVSGIRCQISGDCHMMNFGIFATPERDHLFGPNDFDETIVGPWEWDLKRLVASVMIAARYKGYREADGIAAVRACVASYRARILEYSQLHVLDIWHSRIRVADLLEKELVGEVRLRAAAIVEKARTRTHDQVFTKLVRRDAEGRWRFVDDPPRIFHHGEDEPFRAKVNEVFDHYRGTIDDDRRHLFDRFRLVDFAVKAVGVGSIGRHCVMALLLSKDDQPLVMQIKEAGRSVLEPYVGRSQYEHHGRRVVCGQRLLQAASDMFLGWSGDAQGRHYYLRQMQDMKGSVDIDTMLPEGFNSYVRLCAWALARAHSKAGAAAEIAGYVGKGETLDEALALYAVAYADQAERDFATFQGAIASGRFKADAGVVAGKAAPKRAAAAAPVA